MLTSHSLELWDYTPGIAQGSLQSVCTPMAPDQLQLNPVLLILTAMKTPADIIPAKPLHPNPSPLKNIAQIDNAETGIKEAIPVLSLDCLCCCFFCFLLPVSRP